MRTLKIIAVVGSAAALFFSAAPAFAEGMSPNTQRGTATTTRAVKPPFPPRPQLASTTKANLEAAREEEKQKIEAARTEAKQKIEAVREDAKAKIADKREKAEQHLTDIKDTAKQEMAKRLAGQFDQLNTTWTNHFTEQLDKYTSVVGKIQDRATIAQGKGKDISAVTTAITAAQTAIATAQTAVTAQAAKTYALDTSATVTTTATSTASGQTQLMQKLKAAFKTMHDSLFKDLAALRDGPMTNARKAVQSALQALGKIPGVDGETASTTPAT